MSVLIGDLATFELTAATHIPLIGRFENIRLLGTGRSGRLAVDCGTTYFFWFLVHRSTGYNFKIQNCQIPCGDLRNPPNHQTICSMPQYRVGT